MTRTSVNLYLLTAILLLPGLAHADYCPEKVAAIHRDPLSIEASKVMEQVYADLGCASTRIQPNTAKRSVLDFNKGKTDGNVLRTELIEQQFRREFVRSEVPVIELPGSLWVHPEEEKAASLPMGYVRGYSWHDAYVIEHDKTAIGYGTDQELMDAWSRGQIGSFLGDVAVVGHFVQRKILKVTPEQKEVVFNRPYYHYLSYEYAPFMAAFSKAIAESNPFQAFLEQNQ